MNLFSPQSHRDTEKGKSEKQTEKVNQFSFTNATRSGPEVLLFQFDFCLLTLFFSVTLW